MIEGIKDIIIEHPIDVPELNVKERLGKLNKLQYFAK